MGNRNPAPQNKELIKWRELQALRKNWEELASRVAEMEARAVKPGEGPPVLDFGEAKLGAIASAIFAARRRRLELFEPSLLGEPSWDILLIAFVNTTRSMSQSITELCEAAGVPLATGLRRIEQLQKQNLLRRVRSNDDARVILVELTDEGFDRMRRYILDGITRFQMPLPDRDPLAP